MARNAIESDFRASKMDTGGHFVKKKKEKRKLHIDLKWREMRSKVIFSHPKWPPAAILWRKKNQLRIDLKWREMRLKVIFGHPKWPLAAILWKHFIKNCVLIWNVEKCYQKWFSVIQNVRRGSFCEKKVRKYKSCILIRNSDKPFTEMLVHLSTIQRFAI